MLLIFCSKGKPPTEDQLMKICANVLQSTFLCPRKHLSSKRDILGLYVLTNWLFTAEETEDFSVFHCWLLLPVNAGAHPIPIVRDRTLLCIVCSRIPSASQIR